jgi:GDP-L-fucose synthase
MCESYNRQYGTDYRSVMPTNLYGPGDNYHPENSHVIPALIRKFHKAKVTGADSVFVWGTGKALREFLYVDDMASASVFVMNLTKQKWQNNTQARLAHLNVGYGADCSIRFLAQAISETIGFKGAIVWDKTKPDGTPKKLMDSSKLASLGWQPKCDLQVGLKKTYEWYLRNGLSSNVAHI